MRETVRTAISFAERVPMMALAAILPLTGMCITNITGNVVLTADADWRGLGPVALGPDATINVNGHALKTDGFTEMSFDPGEDVTSSNGTVTSSPIFSGSARFLFDDKFVYSGYYAEYWNEEKNHRFCAQNVSASNPVKITYDFGEGNEKRLRAYRIYFNNQSPAGEETYRAPKDWRFEGSNDNENWRILDRRTDETNWKKPDARTFSFYNQSAYRYYRLVVLAPVHSSVIELYQLEYFLELAGRPVPVDLTVPDPARVTSSALYTDTSATNLFDDTFSYHSKHRLLATTLPCDIVYDFGEGNETVLNGYKIYYKSTSVEAIGNTRGPRDWRFEGSNDNALWTTLDIREGETNWTFDVPREFWFANGTPWRYYRLQVSKSVSAAGYLELYQLEYFRRSAICSRIEKEDMDLTEPGSEHVSNSSTELTIGSVEALFDNNFTRRDDHRLLLHKDKMPFNIVYDFGDGASANVTSYKICYSYPGGGRWPQLWTFAGSNTGGTSENEWTILDSRYETTAWPNSVTNAFSFQNPDNYRYYRLQLQKPATGVNTYVELYQLEFLHEQTGTIQLDIPAGTAQTNGYIALDGALRLVKDGAGSFIAAFSDQTYRGGTVISNGTLAAGLAGDAAPLGKPNESAEDASTVTVCAGGTFDVGGLGGWWNYPFRLDGGTLRCAMPETDAPTDTFRHITLDSDSRLNVAGDFVMGDGTGTNGCLNLGGHVLTASVSSNGLWTLDLPSVTAGTIAFDLKTADAQIGKKVMAWDENAPSSEVRFAKAASGDRGITVLSDGVYVIPNGTLLIFR